MGIASLWSRENRVRMGAAVWVFGMLSERIDAEGLVDGGRPLNCATIAAALGVSESTVRRDLRKLELAAAIEVRRTSAGPVVGLPGCGLRDAGCGENEGKVQPAGNRGVATAAGCTPTRGRGALPPSPARVEDRVAGFGMRDAGKTQPETKPPERETVSATGGTLPLEHETLFREALAAVAPGHDDALPGLIRGRARAVEPTITGLEVAVLLRIARPEGYQIRGNGYFVDAVPKLVRSQAGAFLSEMREYGWPRDGIMHAAERSPLMLVRQAARVLRALLPVEGVLEVAS